MEANSSVEVEAATGRWAAPDRNRIVGLHIAPDEAQSKGPSPRSQDDAKVLRGVHVLIVDDHQDILDLLSVMLQTYGASATAAVSAAEALRLVDTGGIDVIVSDIRMPGMDGYSFLREVRRRAATEGGAVPAIAITAHGEVEERQRAIDAGFQIYLRKPINHVDLVRAVASLVW